MDAETLRWLLTIIIGPAAAAVFIWFTTKYLPLKQQGENESISYARKIKEDARLSDNKVEETSLEAVLTILTQLITHLIQSNNGHMSKLTDAVILGDKEHTFQLEKMTAAYNQALVTLSRAAAFPSVERAAELLQARVKTEAVEETDAIVATVS